MTFRFRLAVILSATFLMVAPSLTFGNVFDNIHTVEKDQFYRSSQLEKPKLEALILERGIRTIINLRGDKTGEAWYDDEALVAKENNVLLVNIGMSAKRYFIRDVWQGLDWAYRDYNPCEGKYKYYDVNSSECQSDGGNDDDGDT